MKLFFCLTIIAGLSSCFQQKPPESIVVDAPVSVSKNIPDGKPILFFLIKDDKIYYKYDSTEIEKKLVEIKPNTKEEIVKVITAIETKYSTSFDKDNILVKADASLAKHLGFKKLKDALKEKQYFKFRIVTTTE